jgi:hypothetical protein
MQYVLHFYILIESLPVIRINIKPDTWWKMKLDPD